MDLKELTEKIELLTLKLDKQSELLSDFVKSKQRSNKFKEILELLKKKNFLDTSQIMTLCSVSRPWAIDLMRRLPYYDKNCIYRKGDTHNSCRVIYKESETGLSKYAKMLVDELKSRPKLSSLEITRILKCNLKEARMVIHQVKDVYPNDIILETNPINANDFKIIYKTEA